MSFAAPLFLMAMLAGIIPVLLHMINRQKAPVMPFSTLRFLRLSVQRTRRRKTVHEILLLLLRIAALALVALALARPTIGRFRGLLGHTAARAVVLILDNSASMATVDETGRRWEAAVRMSELLLDRLAARDSVALLVTCGPDRSAGERLYRNHELVRQALDACRVSHARANVPACLKTARALLARARTVNREIYIITDMQAACWPASSGDTQEPRSAGDDAADGVPLVVVDVRGLPVPNVALGPLELRAAAPVAGVPVQVMATVRGAAGISQQKHVELYVDGRKLAVSPTLAIAADATVHHTFRFTPEQPGVHRGQVALVGADSCVLDNRRFFAVAIDPQIAVGVVQSRSHEIPYLEDTYYLQRALAAVGQGTWATRPMLLTPPALLTERLSKYAALFCVNLPALDPAAAHRLSQYIIGGGHVVWTCGDQVDPDRYNAMNDQVGGQLLPARLSGVRAPPADRADGWHIGWLDDQHAALAPLVEPASVYHSVLVHRHVQMAPTEGSNVRVLARLDDGEPLLVERSVGAGSVLLMATSVHVDWTNLPLRPFFLPLVGRLTFQLADAHIGKTQLAAGTPLEVPVAGGSESAVEIVRPSGETVRFSAGQDQPWVEGHVVRYPNTHEVGVYQVNVIGAERTRQMAFVSNLDAAELDPTTLDRAALKARLGRHHLIFCDDPADLARTVARLREGVSLYEALLVAVLVALVAEAFVANRRVAAETAMRPPPTPPSDRIRRFRDQPDVIDIR